MFLFSSLKKVFWDSTPKTYDPVRKGDRVFFAERTTDLNEGLLYSDFSTQSLLDAEAIDLLRPLSPISASRLAALDSSAAAVSSLSQVVNNIPSDPKSE